MAALTNMVDLQMRGDIAVITVDNPPVNALSHGVRLGLKIAFTQLADNNDVVAIVLACAGRTFIAGADITEFGKPFEEPWVLEVFDAMEASAKPIVAAIHGTALGGGLETALVCHYRVADANAKFGLPEVKLGLLPGAGGTQRLPRVIGPERALEMIVSGDPIGADEALALGLADEIVPGELLDGAVEFARRVASERRPLPLARNNDEKVAPHRGGSSLFDDFRKKHARRMRGFAAPEACIQTIAAAVELPFAEGFAVEQELFGKLMGSPQAKAQQYFFFAEREAAKIPDVPRDTSIAGIKKACVIGGGTMGGGISMCFANAGIPVTMIEITQDALERGLATIRRNYENTAKRGGLTTGQVEQRMACISGSLDRDVAVGDADIVVEAVFENMAVKKEIFASLDSAVRADAILATNTSALDVNEIASATTRPEKVIGMHFFSPANVMRLVEVVRGEHSEPRTIATAMAVSRQLRKVPVLVGVCHGFVGNRMLFGRQREAQKLILEGALPQQVDKVLFDFGLPMGPFAMSDLAGLDIGWSADTSTGSTLRERLCEAGRRGQKTSAGYYDYESGNRTPQPSGEVEKIILEFSANRGINRRDISDDEILARCIYPMINEGAKILEEGIAIRSSDIDVVWVYGYGWPVYRGGPMFYADTVGLQKIVETMRSFQSQPGDDWEVSPLLAKLAAQGTTFIDYKGNG